MAKSQELADFEQIVEKIIFNDDELGQLKIAIKNFTNGKISAKELKRLLLQCRARMVEEITDFGFFFAKKRTANLTQTVKNKQQPSSLNKVESHLRDELKEKNRLLENVADRVNRLVSKHTNEDSGLNKDQNPVSIEEVKEEIERCLTQIGAKQWIEMCYYDDLKFFVKLYPKLEALYEERFGESDMNSKDASESKETMPNRMRKLKFPKDIEKVVIKYIQIRNNFQHTMVDISSSNLGLAREVLVTVFVDLIVNNLKSTLLVDNRERLYSSLTDFFSHRLTDNPVFLKKIVERLETVFKSSSLYPYG